MTVENLSLRKAGPFLGNGITTQFPFSFKLFKTTEVRVIKTDVLGVESVLTLGTDYSCVLNSPQELFPGGIVTSTLPVIPGDQLSILSNVDNVQTLQLTDSGGFYPTLLNDTFDKIVIQIQQLVEQMSRNILLPVGSLTTQVSIAAYVAQAVAAAAQSATSATAAALSALEAAVSKQVSAQFVNIALDALIPILLTEYVEKLANFTLTNFSTIYTPTAFDLGTLPASSFTNENNASRWCNFSSGITTSNYDYGTVP